MNVSNKASWAPSEYVAKTLIKCAQHQQPKQSVFQSPWWCRTYTLKPMYDVSLDVFVWFSRPHHLLVFINLCRRHTHYFKTSLTSPKCNGFDVIDTSLPRFCARRLRNVFTTKNGSLCRNSLRWQHTHVDHRWQLRSLWEYLMSCDAGFQKHVSSLSDSCESQKWNRLEKLPLNNRARNVF